MHPRRRLRPRSLVPIIALVLGAVRPAALRSQDYVDGDGVALTLRSSAPARAGLAGVTEIGRSTSDRPILALLFGLEGPVAPAERPRVLVVAGLNADHRVGSTVAALLPQALHDLAQVEDRVAQALRRAAVEVIPCVDPDGLAALEAGPRRERRVNVRPVDEDRDGLVDEDGPDDLNGDGVILTMRVRDPAGEWRISDEDPRLMVKADPAKGERGGWRLVGEGVDDDGDGAINEDAPGGVDLDRNFAHGWKEHDRAAGTSAPSEPESLALIRHVLAHPAVAAVVVFGWRDNVAAVPEANKAGDGSPPDGPLPDDRPVIEAVARDWKEITGARDGGGDPPDGAFHQWAAYQYGVPAFATRVFYRRDPAELPPLPSGRKPESDEAKWLLWSDRELNGAGIKAWKPWDHPALGPVEIGGFVPLARMNPPAAMLPALVREQARCIADLLARLPRLALAGARAADLGGGVFEIKATLVNEGVFPAITAMGRRARAILPLRVTLELPREAVLHGDPRLLVDELRGGGGHRSLRWVVRGTKGDRVKIKAWSEKAGTAEAVVEL